MTLDYAFHVSRNLFCSLIYYSLSASYLFRWPSTWALVFQLNSPPGEKDIIAGRRRNHIHIQTSFISSRSDPEAGIGSSDLICDFILYLLNFNPNN
ncbi:hypothetical protein L1987_63384 [Smallanthus sonchifolius]|uniref:Uncharacterized protein n=1 Tax=Smallanthus sonchifolius TaxID=185202 RepID=A0ACB9CDB5_9ASTR|nr:hypothetical protein L1987_63384 [Smallanthus sonchifolius]